MGFQAGSYEDSLCMRLMFELLPIKKIQWDSWSSSITRARLRAPQDGPPQPEGGWTGIQSK